MCHWTDYQHLGAVPGQVRHELEEAAAVLEAEQGLVPSPELEEDEPQPAEDQPCTPGWCSGYCWHEEGTGFVYETQRGGGGYAVEDVQAYCLCDHHGALRPRY